MSFSFRQLFGASASSRPEPRNPGLDIRCIQLRRLAEQGGYLFLSGRDYDDFAHGRTEHMRPAVREYFTNVTDPARPTGATMQRMLRDATYGYGGYCDPGGPVIMLPDERGLVERMSKAYGLDPAKLRLAGLTDQHVHADILIHEVCHVIGNDMKPLAKSGTANEMETATRSLLIFLEASGFRPTDTAPAILTGLLAVSSLHQKLNKGEDVSTHGWLDVAFRFVSNQWEARGDYWDSATYRFLDRAQMMMENFGTKYSSDARLRPFGLAKSMIDAGNFDTGNALQDARDRLTTASDANNPLDVFNAMLVLENYETMLRFIAPYCVEGSPLLNACRGLIPDAAPPRPVRAAGEAVRQPAVTAMPSPAR